MFYCKKCKSDDISTLKDMEDISYKGASIAVEIESSHCNNCHREFVSTQQILNNDANLRDAKKKHDGLLTSDEIYQARKALGLTQDQASAVFGGGRNAFSKYERAEVSQSVAMDKLVRVCLRYPAVFEELCDNSGVMK